MAKAHGKNTVLTIAAHNISPYTKNSMLTRSAKTSDLTGYGMDAEVHGGSLVGGKFTCDGVYDNTATVGPRNVLGGMEGTTMAIIRQPEGAGTGLPQDSFDGVLESYDETNPHDDYIKWSASFIISGGVDDTAQS